MEFVAVFILFCNMKFSIREQLANDINPLYEQAYFLHDLQHISWQVFT
jgi:hypothetical protein